MLRTSINVGARTSAPWLVSDLDLIIPVYRNKQLVERCLASLLTNTGEIAEHNPRLIVVNDSPDDIALSEFLRAEASEGRIELLIENPTNLGFVKSVNKALSKTRERRASAILINSDTQTFPGTLSEMVAVANLDTQTGFVCPRSNNASICTFPAPRHARSGTTLNAEDCYGAWLELHDALPRISYVPTAVGFYMLIKEVVIRNFGKLDETFGVGYEEENDLVLRAGKVGFRAVIANHCFAYHAGSASFSLLDFALDDHRSANHAVIRKLHPEFGPLLQTYDESAEVRAERMLKGLLRDCDGRLSIAFNLFYMGDYFNGTNEFIVGVLREFCREARERFDITLLCQERTAAFHALDKLGVKTTSELGGVYGICLKFGQPYDLHAINVMEDLAPVNVYCMLDMISLDCGPLRHSQGVTALWSHVASTANGCAFISEVSADNFANRFPGADVARYTALLPTRPECYTERYAHVRRGQAHVFVAGNQYDHKDSTRAAKMLAMHYPTLGFIAMGAAGVYPPNVRQLRSGSVSDSEMTAAMAESSAIVLPSYYEGFGFTFMHALALNKPIVARDIPATREILGKFGEVAGVYLFADDVGLADAVHAAIEGPPSSVSGLGGLTWRDWSHGLEEFLNGLVQDRATIYPKLVTRIRSGDYLRLKQQSAMGAVSAQAAVNGDISATRKPQNVRLRWEDLRVLSDTDFVELAYSEFLGRSPDAEGQSRHLDGLQSGVSRTDVLEAFRVSEEFRNTGRTVIIDGLPIKKLRLGFPFKRG